MVLASTAQEKFNELMDAAEGYGSNLLNYMKTEFAEPLGLQSTINAFKKTAYYAMEEQKNKFKSSWRDKMILLKVLFIV